MSALTSALPRRVAFVTGAARGIGYAIACRLARDGLNVAVNDIPSNAEPLAAAVKELESLGAKSIAVLGDVSDEASTERMVNEVAEKLGSLDVMIANAGINLIKPLLDVSAEEIDRIFSVNVRGVFLSYKYAANQMIKQGKGGKLIAASSIGGFKLQKLLTPYCATKFAVRGLNQGAALELAPHGITANCYCPGLVGTDMWKMIDERIHELEGVPIGDSFTEFSKSIPLGRPSVPEDVANLVSFLASKDSDYVTGQSIIVDGGIRMS